MNIEEKIKTIEKELSEITKLFHKLVGTITEEFENFIKELTEVIKGSKQQFKPMDEDCRRIYL